MEVAGKQGQNLKSCGNTFPQRKLGLKSLMEVDFRENGQGYGKNGKMGKALRGKGFSRQGRRGWLQSASRVAIVWLFGVEIFHRRDAKKLHKIKLTGMGREFQEREDEKHKIGQD